MTSKVSIFALRPVEAAAAYHAVTRQSSPRKPAPGWHPECSFLRVPGRARFVAHRYRYIDLSCRRRVTKTATRRQDQLIKWCQLRSWPATQPVAFWNGVDIGDSLDELLYRLRWELRVARHVGVTSLSTALLTSEPALIDTFRLSV